MKENMERICKVSKRFRMLFQIGFWAIPLAFAVFWASLNWIFAYTPPLFPVPLHIPLPNYILALGFVASMILGGMLMWTIYLLIDLFKLYESGIIFTEKNVNLFKKLGLVILLSVPARVVTKSLLSVILTLEQPKRTLTLTLSSDEGFSLVFGGVVILISWVMLEAQKLQKDHDLTI